MNFLVRDEVSILLTIHCLEKRPHLGVFFPMNSQRETVFHMRFEEYCRITRSKLLTSVSTGLVCIKCSFLPFKTLFTKFEGEKKSKHMTVYVKIMYPLRIPETEEFVTTYIIY